MQIRDKNKDGCLVGTNIMTCRQCNANGALQRRRCTVRVTDNDCVAGSSAIFQWKLMHHCLP